MRIRKLTVSEAHVRHTGDDSLLLKQAVLLFVTRMNLALEKPMHYRRDFPLFWDGATWANNDGEVNISLYGRWPPVSGDEMCSGSLYVVDDEHLFIALYANRAAMWSWHAIDDYIPKHWPGTDGHWYAYDLQHHEFCRIFSEVSLV